MARGKEEEMFNCAQIDADVTGRYGCIVAASRRTRWRPRPTTAAHLAGCSLASRLSNVWACKSLFPVDEMWRTVARPALSFTASSSSMY